MDTQKNSGEGKTPKPIVLSINICDTIIRDETTKKVSLIGLFNAIKANTFPSTHPLFHVYVALTNGHGPYKTTLRIVNIKDNEVIINIDGDLNVDSPLQVIELNIGLQGLRFKGPGKYSVQVLCGGEPIGSRDFMVVGPTQLPNTSGTEVK
jgi:hypothetical protein